jgi:hypothetical protein
MPIARRGCGRVRLYERPALRGLIERNRAASRAGTEVALAGVTAIAIVSMAPRLIPVKRRPRVAA